MYPPYSRGDRGQGNPSASKSLRRRTRRAPSLIPQFFEFQKRRVHLMPVPLLKGSYSPIAEKEKPLAERSVVRQSRSRRGHRKLAAMDVLEGPNGARKDRKFSNVERYR